MDKRKLATMILISCAIMVVYCLVEIVKLLRQGRIVYVVPETPNMIEGKVIRNNGYDSGQERESVTARDNRTAH